MKILKIELQNINSLKSEIPFVIDFEQPEFKDIGLYAITGSTGAGKTTILDAITIGLYHRVPRFNKSNIKAGLFDVVSYGASEAMSRVTFLSKNEIYEAQWSLRIKGKTGKPLANPVESVRLKNLSQETIIGEKKTEVQKAIIDITQLNYDQFLRSVLLAQGEFAAFLSANAKDKGTLLEQITGEEIYKKIGNLISEKIYAEKKLLEEKKSKINTEDLLSETDKNILNLRFKEVETENRELESKLLNLQIKINWFSNKSELESQQKVWKEKNAWLIQSKEENKSVLEALIQHKSALPYAVELTNLQRLEKEKASYNELKSKLFQNQTKLDELVKVKSEMVLNKKNENDELENFSKLWIPKLERVTYLDNSKLIEEKNVKKLKDTQFQLEVNLKSESKKRQELEQFKKDEIQNSLRINAFLNEKKQIPEFEKHFTLWNSKLTERKITFETKSGLQVKENDLKRGIIKIEKIKKQTDLEVQTSKLKLQELELRLSSNKLKIDANSIEKNTAKLHKIESDIVRWDNVKIHYSNWMSQNRQKQILIEKSAELNKKIEQNIQDKEELTAKNKALRISLNDAIRIFEQAQLIKRFENERLELKPNMPCSLCGSKSHPFIEHYDSNTFNSDKKLVEERTLAFEKAEKLSQENMTSYLLFTQELEPLKLRISETETQIKKWAEILDKNNINPESIKNHQIDENTTLLIAEKKAIEKVIEGLQSDSKVLEILEKEVANKKEKVVDFKQKQAVLVEKEQQYNNQIKDLAKTIFENNTKIIELENTLESSFSTLNIKLPSFDLTDNFLERLKNSISGYNENIKQKEISKTKIEKLEIETNASTNILLKIEEQSKEIGKEMAHILKLIDSITTERISILPLDISVLKKREELEGSVEKIKLALNTAKEDYQNIITKKALNTSETEINKTHIKKVENSLIDLSKTLSNVIQKSDFANINEINQALLPTEIETKYQNKYDELIKIETEVNSKKIELDKKMVQLNTEQNFSESKSELEENIVKIKHQKENYLKEIGSIKTKFDLDKQIIERNSAVVSEIKVQEKVYHKWSHLMNLLGGSKHAFNTYVQRLTLKSLIDLANIHLFKLNKRYSLKMADTYKTGEELNFKLVDHYQTDMTRFVDTSSGGEKFLISLALALGLSDLSSNNVQIGSLFIDEGFGTLDQNTLETVISTLETLQAQGKMIGIISHVENLKERISTQIKVIKKSNGISTVEIV